MFFCRQLFLQVNMGGVLVRIACLIGLAPPSPARAPAPAPTEEGVGLEGQLLGPAGRPHHFNKLLQLRRVPASCMQEANILAKRHCEEAVLPVAFWIGHEHCFLTCVIRRSSKTREVAPGPPPLQYEVLSRVEAMKGEADRSTVVQCDFFWKLAEVESPICLPNVLCFARCIVAVQLLSHVPHGRLLVESRDSSLQGPCISTEASTIRESVATSYTDRDAKIARAATRSRAPPIPRPASTVGASLG
mmetsp:Transcript_86361/g.189662  ORF Transcript_86361/g.189662 Transcript_86361/m.189662 type:complete len:246 (-) Transcript_86361:46-783(-)